LAKVSNNYYGCLMLEVVQKAGSVFFCPVQKILIQKMLQNAIKNYIFPAWWK